MNQCIEFSQDRDELLRTLFAVQGEIEPIKKMSVNDYHHSKYADLATVFDAVLPVLRKHEILLTQAADVNGQLVAIETLLIHLPSGQWMRNILCIAPDKLNPQGVKGAVTYGRRISIEPLLGIAPEDDDGNVASGIGSRQSNDLGKMPKAFLPFTKAKEEIAAAGNLEGCLERVEQNTDNQGIVWTNGYINEKRIYTRDKVLGNEMLRFNDCDCEVQVRPGKKPNDYQLLGIK